MKLIFEILLSIVLHPIAVILMWIHLAGRDDLALWQKAVWVLTSVLWGVGPILYILVGGGTLW